MFIGWSGGGGGGCVSKVPRGNKFSKTYMRSQEHKLEVTEP
jgi:hypothetical protein